MKVIDVYKQYFSADCIFNSLERKGAMVCLTTTSDSGNIKYEVSVCFFPHRDETDFAISYDAYNSKEIFNSKGRRSKKREQQFLSQVQTVADEIAKEMNGVIYWEKPLREAQYG